MKLFDLLTKRIRRFKELLEKSKEDSNKIKLDIIGVSNTSLEDKSLYAIILGEENGERKVPIIVNYIEAQSIAIEVEKIKMSVPLIYDFIKNLIIENKIKFDEIIISDFKNDILITHLTNKKIQIELRTADALALSIRMGYPIYIYNNVLKKVDDMVQKYYDIRSGNYSIGDDNSILKELTFKELDDLLKTAIDNEEYEKASLIRDEIIKKKKEII